jgi:hypothetical protein
MTLQIDTANFSGKGDRSPQSLLWLSSCDSTNLSGGGGRSPQSRPWLRHWDDTSSESRLGNRRIISINISTGSLLQSIFKLVNCTAMKQGFIVSMDN